MHRMRTLDRFVTPTFLPRLTHWKQDLLMLEDPVEVTKGMRLRGTLAIRRNPLWRRHYIIDLSFAFGEDVERTNRTFLMWR